MELKLKVTKRGIVTGLILLILLAVYNVLFFVIPFNRSYSNGSFWVTYGVTSFLIVFMAVVVFIGFHDKDIKSRVFGVPIVYLGYSALLVQLIVDGAVMAVGNFFEIKIWIAIIVETLLLAFFFISLIARTAYKDTIKKVDAQKERKAYMQDLRVQLDTLVGTNSIEAIKPELEKLAETVRFADPVSSKASVDTEDQITVAFESLSKAVANGDVEKAQVSIAKMNRLLNERKALLKNSK
ncbi:MAG: hypothetical protein K6E11_04605 [Bacilli bacterium]|nr:hypothetical protein [Bacilli bacterium]